MKKIDFREMQADMSVLRSIAYRSGNRGQDIDDAVQEGMIKVFLNQDKIEESATGFWRKSVEFASLNHKRSEKINQVVGRRDFREFSEIREELPELGGFVPSTEDIVMEAQEKAIVNDDLRYLVMQLPPRQKQITLMFLDGVKMTEIAILLDLPYDSAKASFRHAVVTLREWMGVTYEDEQT